MDPAASLPLVTTAPQPSARLRTASILLGILPVSPFLVFAWPYLGYALFNDAASGPAAIELAIEAMLLCGLAVISLLWLLRLGRSRIALLVFACVFSLGGIAILVRSLLLAAGVGTSFAWSIPPSPPLQASFAVALLGLRCSTAVVLLVNGWLGMHELRGLGRA